MHGLINRSVEGFLRRTYGEPVFARVMARLDLGFDEFEPMFLYPDALTTRLVDAAAADLGRAREDLLEDLGTFLVADPGSERIRRLLRFGGADYADCLHSLEELQGRARLAVADLDLPEIAVSEEGEGEFRLTCSGAVPGFGHVLLGLLRALADDYGVLALLDHMGSGPGGAEVIAVRMLQKDFSPGRDFDLVATRG